MNKSDFYGAKTARWDEYFLQICESVAKKSPCLSRQIGAILVRDQSIVSTGYNGPPRGYYHCSANCPRKQMGLKSGEGLEFCPAVHAESNAISNAARIGASTINSTLYMNCIVPCKNCMGELINAGVRTIVVTDILPYHELSLDMVTKCKINIRKFKI